MCPIRKFAAVILTLCLALTPAWGGDGADVAALRQKVKGDATDGASRFALGMEELHAGDLAGAERDLSAARDHGLEAETVLPPLGQALLRLGRYDDVINGKNDCSSAACTANLISLRARALMRLGRADEAKGLIDHALAADAASPESQLAQIEWLTANGSAQQAEQSIDKMIAAPIAAGLVEPKILQADYFTAKGDLRRRAGDFAGAEKAYRAELDLLPASEAERSRLVLSLIAQGRFDQAREEIVPLALRPHPSLLTIYLDALSLQGLGRSAEALTTLRWVERQMADTPQGALLLGVVQSSTGNLEEARGYVGHFHLAQQSDLPSLLLLGRINFGLGEYSRAIDLVGPIQDQIKDQAKSLELLGSAYLGMGASGDAARLLSAADHIQPLAPLLKARLALAQSRLPNKAAEGIATLEAITRKDPAIREIGLSLIEIYLARKELLPALEAANRLAAARPADPLPRTVQAILLRQKGDLAAAEAAFKAARAASDSFYPAILGLADLYIATGRPGDAQSLIQPELERHPSNLGLLLASAALEKARGNQAKAAEAEETAIVAQPEDILSQAELLQSLVALGDQDRAVRVATLLADNWGSDAVALDLAARVLIETGRQAEALKLFRQMQPMLPPSAETWERQAEMFRRAAQWGDAQAALDRALQLEPGNAKALADRISIEYRRAGPEAAALLARTLYRRLESAAAADRSVERLMQPGHEPAEALIAARALFELHPAAAAARHYGLALARTGDLPGAQRLLSDWLAKSAEDADSRALLAELLMRQGERAQAADHWNRVLAQQPDNVSAVNNLAWLYGKLGDRRALDVAQHAYQLAPGRPEIADTYGFLLFGKGDKSRATDLLRAAHAAKPAEPSFAYHLAYALADGGDRDGARDLLRPVIESNAAFEESGEARQLFDRLKG